MPASAWGAGPQDLDAPLSTRPLTDRSPRRSPLATYGHQRVRPGHDLPLTAWTGFVDAIGGVLSGTPRGLPTKPPPPGWGPGSCPAISHAVARDFPHTCGRHQMNPHITRYRANFSPHTCSLSGIPGAESARGSWWDVRKSSRVSIQDRRPEFLTICAIPAGVLGNAGIHRE